MENSAQQANTLKVQDRRALGTLHTRAFCCISGLAANLLCTFWRLWQSATLSFLKLVAVTLHQLVKNPVFFPPCTNTPAHTWECLLSSWCFSFCFCLLHLRRGDRHRTHIQLCFSQFILRCCLKLPWLSFTRSTLHNNSLVFVCYASALRDPLRHDVSPQTLW